MYSIRNQLDWDLGHIFLFYILDSERAVHFFLSDFSDNPNSHTSEQDSQPLERTLVGNDDEEEDEIVIDRHVAMDNLQGEDIPFTSECSDPANLMPLANRNTLVQFEEERPDTGMFVQLCCTLITVSKHCKTRNHLLSPIYFFAGTDK